MEQKSIDAGGLQNSLEQDTGRARRKRQAGSVSIIVSEDDLNDCSSLAIWPFITFLDLKSLECFPFTAAL